MINEGQKWFRRVIRRLRLKFWLLKAYYAREWINTLHCATFKKNYIFFPFKIFFSQKNVIKLRCVLKPRGQNQVNKGVQRVLIL